MGKLTVPMTKTTVETIHFVVEADTIQEAEDLVTSQSVSGWESNPQCQWTYEDFPKRKWKVTREERGTVATVSECIVEACTFDEAIEEAEDNGEFEEVDRTMDMDDYEIDAVQIKE